jgi:hypothetical protein
MSLDLLPDLHARLLRVVSAGDAASIEVWEAWYEAIDWSGDVDPHSTRLLPLLYRNLKRHGLKHQAMPMFAGIGRKHWASNMRFFHDLSPVLSNLAEAAGLVMIGHPLGLAMLEGEFGLRPLEQVDLIVRRTSVPAAIHSLQASGWKTGIRLPTGWLAGYAAACDSIRLYSKAGPDLRLRWELPGHQDENPNGSWWTGARQADLLTQPVLLPDAAAYLWHILTAPPPRAGAALYARLTDLAWFAAAYENGGLDIERWTRLLQGRTVDPAAASVLKAAGELYPALFPASLLPPLLHAIDRSAEEDPQPEIRRPRLIERMRSNWSQYRRGTEQGGSLLTAVAAFPGYLMAKWRLGHPAQLPVRLWRSLTYQWRKS